MTTETAELKAVRELARVLVNECRVAAKGLGEAAASLRAFAHRHKELRGWPLLGDVADWLEAAETALDTVSRHAQDVFEALLDRSAEG